MRGLIMTAAPVGASVSPLFGPVPSALVPLNGRPVLLTIAQELAACGVRDLTLVVGHQAERVREVCARFLSADWTLHFIELPPGLSAGQALTRALESFEPQDEVLLNLGDTLVPGLAETLARAPVDRLLVLSATPEPDEHRWCGLQLAEGGTVQGWHNACCADGRTPVAAGVYRLPARAAGTVLPNAPGTEISDVLQACLGPGQTALAWPVARWYDVGHLECYQVARKRLLESRSFNALQFDDFLGTVTKRSVHWRKLGDEARWALQLPAALQALAPRVTEFVEAGPDTRLTLEYYGYPTAAELWLYGAFPASVLTGLARRLLQVLDRFAGEQRPVPPEDFDLMYRVKTEQRVADAMRGNPVLARLLSAPALRLNGRWQPGWPALWQALRPRLADLWRPEDCTLIHGDLCLSNVLYDVGGGIVRLIDARGRWGSEDSPIGAGDLKYDLAKLRHSLCGGYDFIVNDLFDLRLGEDGTTLDWQLARQPQHRAVAAQFDALLAPRHDLQEVRLIEALLFISMLPLHADRPRRQLAMAGVGLAQLAACLHAQPDQERAPVTQAAPWWRPARDAGAPLRRPAGP